MIYLCLPNNPTGTTITKAQLQEWVDYANKVGAVIIYDGAYEAYISEDDVAHSIYECEGAKTCAIELKSFSKNAGFTGVRLGLHGCPEGIKMRTTYPYMTCGHAAMAPSSTARRISCREPEKQYTPQPERAQLKEQVGILHEERKDHQGRLKRCRI